MSPDQLAALVKVTEAVIDGDRAYAAELISDLAGGNEPVKCPVCDLKFPYPGLRDAHELDAHPLISNG